MNNKLLLPCGRSWLLQRHGRVFAFRSCSPGSFPTCASFDFSAHSDIFCKFDPPVMHPFSQIYYHKVLLYSSIVDLLLKCVSPCLLEFCVCLCFVMHYFVSILVLQSS